MYKVLIIDNENLTGNTLRDFMGWGGIGCEVVGVVKDALEAWDFYQEKKPQIIFVDVALFEDYATSFIENIRKQDKTCEFIAISEISDVEVVKKVMKAGAFEYLQKQDVIKETLVNCVKLVQMKIRGTNNSIYYMDGAAIDKLQQNLLLMHNGYNIEKEEFNKLLIAPVFEQYRPGCVLAKFRIHNQKIVEEETLENEDVQETEEIYTSEKLSEMIEEHLPLYMKARVLFMSDKDGYIMFQSKEIDRVVNAADGIVRHLKEKADIALSLLLSEVIEEFEGFYETCLTFIQKPNLNFYADEISVTQMAHIKKFYPLRYSDVSQHITILKDIKERRFQQIGLLQHELVEYMRSHRIEPQEVIHFFVFIFYNIEGNEMASGVKKEYHFEEIFELLGECKTMQGLNRTLSICFQKIVDWIMDIRQNKYRKDIVDIMEFIQKHYRTRITLKMIADNFNINESYLSRMFKNETGKNVIYFVNELK
ncbi:MAG: response regulator, partial [Erysipelotrichaceae bacterium]|nr:response regulator [Erysipelotrichaceae bacterium]